MQLMIMGDTCTRACAFCNVKTGLQMLRSKSLKCKSKNDLNLKHVVITSVDRDDLEDGGAEHFAQTILEIKIKLNTSVEILTPDFLKKVMCIKKSS